MLHSKRSIKRFSKVVKERTRGTTKNDNTNARRIVVVDDDTDIFFAPRRLFVAKKETLWLVVVGQSRRPNSTQCIDVDDIDAKMRTREEEE